MVQHSPRAGASSKKEAPKVEFPPDAAILIHARVKAGEPQLRVNEIANLIMHDPVVTLAVLQYANSIVFAGARSEVFSAEAAIQRLGTERLIQTLTELSNRPVIENEDCADWFEVLRYHCRRVSILSLIIAKATWPPLADQARASGLFSEIGHMVVLMELGKHYCDLAKKYHRKPLIYRLEKDRGLRVADLQLRYLRARGVPEEMIGPYEAGKECKSASEANLRFIVQSAEELMEAYDTNKLETFDTAHPLPARSALRLLGVTPPQHQRIYEAGSLYLKKMAQHEAPKSASFIAGLEEDENAEFESLGSVSAGIRQEKVEVPRYPAPAVNAKSRGQLKGLYQLCDGAAGDAALRGDALKYLVGERLFARAAFIRVSPLEKSALVEAAAGSGLEEGKKLPLDDPLSPLNLFTLEVKSARVSEETFKSPFGISAYALGPVSKYPSGEKLLLYADCGSEELLPMESRRIFRLVIGILGQTFQMLHERSAAETGKKPG